MDPDLTSLKKIRPRSVKTKSDISLHNISLSVAKAKGPDKYYSWITWAIPTALSE